MKRRTDIHPLLRSDKDVLDDPDTQARITAAGVPELIIPDGPDGKAREVFLSGSSMDGRMEKDRVAAIRELKKTGVIP